MEEYCKKNMLFAHTKDARDLLGLRILSVSGEVLGKIAKVRLNPTTNELEGIVCSRSVFSNPSDPCYFCKDYIDRITDDAALLNIEPTFIWVGHDVITADGKVVGRVNKVNRVANTNDIESFFFKRSFFRTATIPARDVKKIGTSIVLKTTYLEVKKHGFK